MATVVEGDQKAPFSIVTTPKCWGRYSFPKLFHFTRDTYLILLSVKQGSISRTIRKHSILWANEPRDMNIYMHIFLQSCLYGFFLWFGSFD